LSPLRPIPYQQFEREFVQLLLPCAGWSTITCAASEDRIPNGRNHIRILASTGETLATAISIFLKCNEAVHSKPNDRLLNQDRTNGTRKFATTRSQQQQAAFLISTSGSSSSVTALHNNCRCTGCVESNVLAEHIAYTDPSERLRAAVRPLLCR
jgi:hypothetical protein